MKLFCMAWSQADYSLLSCHAFLIPILMFALLWCVYNITHTETSCRIHGDELYGFVMTDIGMWTMVSLREK